MYNDWLIIYNTMKKLDNRQMFEQDDQVGGLFLAIKQLITDYTIKINQEIK